MGRQNRFDADDAPEDRRIGGGLAVDRREPTATGPYDGDDLDPEIIDAMDTVDFGAVRVPVPARGTVSVEPAANGRTQAVHIALPEGRLSVSALAAPKTSKLWPDLATEIGASLRDGGARVRSFTGEWGRELHATSGGATSVFVGVDGPRWMLYGVATGPTSDAVALDAELRRMLRGTVVTRGRSPYPVRTVLPLVVPDHLAEDLAEDAAAPAAPEPAAGAARLAAAGPAATAPPPADPVHRVADAGGDVAGGRDMDRDVDEAGAPTEAWSLPLDPAPQGPADNATPTPPWGVDAVSGTATSGTATSGTATSGTATSGTATSGTAASWATARWSGASQGAAANGAAANGAAANGAAANGARTNGARSSSAHTNGAAADGVAANGSAPTDAPQVRPSGRRRAPEPATPSGSVPTEPWSPEPWSPEPGPGPSAEAVDAEPWPLEPRSAAPQARPSGRRRAPEPNPATEDVSTGSWSSDARPGRRRAPEPAPATEAATDPTEPQPRAHDPAGRADLVDVPTQAWTLGPPASTGGRRRAPEPAAAGDPVLPAAGVRRTLGAEYLVDTAEYPLPTTGGRRRAPEPDVAGPSVPRTGRRRAPEPPTGQFDTAAAPAGTDPVPGSTTGRVPADLPVRRARHAAPAPGDPDRAEAAETVWLWPLVGTVDPERPSGRHRRPTES